jgi:hypothetical protein
MEVDPVSKVHLSKEGNLFRMNCLLGVHRRVIAHMLIGQVFVFRVVTRHQHLGTDKFSYLNTLMNARK